MTGPTGAPPAGWRPGALPPHPGWVDEPDHRDRDAATSVDPRAGDAMASCPAGLSGSPAGSRPHGAGPRLSVGPAKAGDPVAGLTPALDAAHACPTRRPEPARATPRPPGRLTRESAS